ncbi:MAG: lipid A deacylase LpxR family protein [Pseudomonadota bacterium]
MPRLVFVLAALIAATPPAFAAGADAERGTWSFTFENDSIAESDRNYTNGVRFDYVTPPNDLTAAGRFLRRNLSPVLGRAHDWYEIYTLGQNMYTPADISLATPPPDDRPYGGYLYAGYGVAADRGNRLDVLALELGVVGPASGAEETQTRVHELLQVGVPRGWDHQLANEPGVRLVYQRAWRALGRWQLPLFELSADVAPHVSVALGNVETSAAAGGVVRLGDDLEDDYGPPRVLPAVAAPGFFQNRDGFSWHVFAGVEGRGVARNIFVEGNSRGGVDGVDAKRFVADVQAGLSLQIGRVQLTYTHVLRTREFEGQDEPSIFGSLNLRARF